MADGKTYQTEVNIDVNTRQWNLEAGTEYRFELDPGTTVAIKLAHGQAEIFGAELAEGSVYLFGFECKAAVYTWQGCTIEVIGLPSTEYVSDETPMHAYANVHLALEQMRVRALRTVHGSPPSSDDEADTDANPEPPRVLVLGPENSGKTTVAKILVNYAVRTGQDWTPMLLNTDPGEGGWAVPGAIAAAPISSPIQTSTPATTLGCAASSAPTHLTSNALLPLAYWYGHAETKRNPLLMDRLIRNLGDNVAERWDHDVESRVSGLIVDTPSSFAASSGAQNEHRHALIKACVDAFKINVILVVGHEKLNVEMQRTYGNRMTVVKIPKSGGVVELDASYRERVRKYQLQNYMYGKILQPPPGLSTKMYLQGGEQIPDLTLNLAPVSSIVSFGDLTLYRIGEETMAPTSALPIGATRVVSEMQPLLVDPAQPGSGLYNAVLALLAPPNPDEHERYDEEILDLPVVGFLVVTALDIPNKRMTILSPSQGSLVGRTAIVGSFEWQE
ncbi:Pre-mRNA cleavage complex II protein Clp1-domain-containing protein [Rhodofomes roseus]|uniref:Polynucleotide 5'-hydroxyl-kinase GRC3 n=1 Tax=Rhodofomes roseus TaxID=34475 RepID=A0ABQ8K6Z0_9APHY|nr:Pre-mRNA cleavage complex II protein Clp1-domain-containing protein [Rhodofomes roseus]KAH9833021.1 Pre-mRNA cleavage complex II protein Clp1-domain-containing protein [Rhodofomes roseus]